MSRRLSLAALPIVFFAALAVLFWRGLSGDPARIPSALIGKQVPEFSLAAIPDMGVPGLDTAGFKAGNVSVVNVWASWCVPCRSELPLLKELARRTDIRLVGINTKDEAENARRFLGAFGQPFAAIGSDENGRAAVDWGVYGVPETFIVDGAGFIRYKLIGEVTADVLAGTLSAEIAKAKLPSK